MLIRLSTNNEYWSLTFPAGETSGCLTLSCISVRAAPRNLSPTPTTVTDGAGPRSGARDSLWLMRRLKIHNTTVLVLAPARHPKADSKAVMQFEMDSQLG